MGFGDFSCQKLEQHFLKKEGLDLDRLFSFSFYGLTINGPMLHCAYHHIIPWLAPGKNGPSAIAKKMLFS
jgi:hypothetical protein